MEQFELFNRREGHENQTQASETSCVQESRGSDMKDQDKQNSSVPGPPAPGAPEEEDMGGRDIGSGDRGSIQDLKGERTAVKWQKGILALQGNSVSSSLVSRETRDSCCPFLFLSLQRS